MNLLVRGKGLIYGKERETSCRKEKNREGEPGGVSARVRENSWRADI